MTQPPTTQYTFHSTRKFAGLNILFSDKCPVLAQCCNATGWSTGMEPVRYSKSGVDTAGEIEAPLPFAPREP